MFREASAVAVLFISSRNGRHTEIRSEVASA